MNLVNYYPFKRISHLQNELNNLFQSGDFFPAGLDESSVSTSQWIPTVDIKDEDDKFVIRADIPGVAPKDIDISMENGVLTIKGERNAEEKDEGKGYRRIECSYGSFYRRFSLPDTADGENIKATGKDGVLEITVGKREASKARKIQVKA